VPAVRLARELLLPLTGRPPYDTSVVLPRRVSSACLVAYDGHHDSVPYLAGGHPVQPHVYEEQALLEIDAEETCLAVHPPLPGHGRQGLHPGHLDGRWYLTLQGKEQRPLRALSPPPTRGESTCPLHLPGLSAMPEVEVHP
jgi:hypothetical protein